MNTRTIKATLDNSDFVFFFRHAGKVYGAGESSRLIFATFKDRGDHDNTLGWRREATFTAMVLADYLRGKETQTVFGMKDIKDIKVIPDVDEVIRQVSKDL